MCPTWNRYDPPLKPEKYVFVQPKTRYFQTLNQRPLLHRFCARQLSPSQAKQQRNNFRKVFTEASSCCYIQSSAVCSITSCCFFLSVWLSPSLSISHCLTLLSDYCEVLKRNQRGICAPLCRSVPVLSVAVSSHLILHFCPSRHTHTIFDTHIHITAEGIELWLPLCILCQV